MNKDKLKQIITDFYEINLPSIISRQYQIPLDTGKVITLTGPRRSGKTFLLYQLINQIFIKSIDKHKILYLNFEDERLEKDFQLEQIIEAYQELFPENNLSQCYLFFDEIQNISGWEKFIRRIHDTITQNIYITGSNSSLLSKDIATSLRGRTLTFEILPLSFSEYLKFKEIPINLDSTKSKAKIIHAFNNFLTNGAFPETVFIDSQFHQKLLQEYFNTMLFRDLIERYDISQINILKYFCKRLIACGATEFSVHKIYNELKSQGYKIAKNTLYEFQDYVESIYLSQFLNKYDQSVVKRELAQKKAYIIDTGLAAAVDFKFSQDSSRQLETCVYLELKKQNQDIAYLKNGFECDFITLDRGKVTQAIQVSVQMDDEDTKAREVQSLIKACQRFDLSKGYILTKNHKEEINQDGVDIQILPAWQYFLAGNLS